MKPIRPQIRKKNCFVCVTVMERTCSVIKLGVKKIFLITPEQ